jgi:lysozyme
MKLSEDGLRLIKSFEGYHRKLPDGRCVAYRCPANVLTLGYGCTEGIREGMTWTQEEAEAALLREIAKFEAAVERAVTVEINQNEADALISFAYNCGVGALQKSTLLRKLNKGDRAGTAREFAKWNKGGGKVLPGLVSRRAREAALFLKPAERPDDPIMPQKVEETTEVSKTAVGVGAGGAAAGGALTIPTPPDLSAFGAWRGWGETVSSLGAWAWQRPFLTFGVISVAAFLAFWPKQWRPS